MGKPLGYFNLSHENELVKDVAETWGDGLEGLTEADTLWLIARIAHEAWLQEPSESAPTEEAEEVVDRLHELSYHEKLNLLQALSQ
ncbi:MAG: hypothetical protein HC815_04075 [Richelia sp. RM1_1_1]|nr:hypothetical protein [Richelia sp. RM1_1_1]